jgi:hypothetical protein
MEMAELTWQCPLSFGIAGVKFPHLGIEEIVEEKRPVLGPLGRRPLGIKPSTTLRFLTRHNGPAYLSRIGKDPGLDGFVFSGCGHCSGKRCR